MGSSEIDKSSKEAKEAKEAKETPPSSQVELFAFFGILFPFNTLKLDMGVFFLVIAFLFVLLVISFLSFCWF